MRVIALLLCFGCSQNDDRPAQRRVEPDRVVVQKPVEPKPGVSRRLFADDVPVGTLPLSIAIETIGGVSTVLIPRGTRLPVSRTEVFSTALDNQASVEVHILQGERPMASDNRSLGKFQLTGIPPAPRGVPQIEVIFAMDEQGILNVSARDKATNAMKEVIVEGSAGALDKVALAKILEDTAAASQIDDERRAWSETRNKLETLVYSGKRLLGDVGTKLSPAMRKRWVDEIARAETVLATSTTPGDPKLLALAMQQLEKAMHEGAEELYRTAK